MHTSTVSYNKETRKFTAEVPLPHDPTLQLKASEFKHLAAVLDQIKESNPDTFNWNVDHETSQMLAEAASTDEAIQKLLGG
jgi:hypothetical protein